MSLQLNSLIMSDKQAGMEVIMAESIIKVENLVKSFGDHEVLKKIDFEISKGEVVCIIGSSGSGKSTLLRCINHLETPTGGKILFHGEEVKNTQSSLSKYRSQVGMVFQSFNLFNNMTVLKNCMFGVQKILHLSKEEAKLRAIKHLREVGMAAYINAKPAQLSGGQKQRVAIARALANDPKVLLCDEATSALDPQTTQSILKLLKKVNEEMGITIVLITHEMAVVKDICDRVAIMEEGTVVEAGNTVDVFSHPQVRITRDFIDTASNIRKIYDLIEDKNELTQIGAGDRMLLFTYSGANAGEPLISYLAKAFDIRANIIFGNIDFLKGKPLGKLVVTLSGEADKMEKAMEYINSLGVEVEVIKE